VPGPPLRVAPDAEGRARLQRGHLLFATLAALGWPGYRATRRAGRPAPVAPLVGGHRHIAAGMARQQDDLESARHGEKGWRATFYPVGIAHSMTGSVGTAWETTPFDAMPGRGARSAPQREQRTVPTMVTRP
jgi:hypothetical protein